MRVATGILALVGMVCVASPALARHTVTHHAIVGSAIAGSIVVPMDEARIVTFSKPIATLFVANPAVADVNMIDSTHAFVLGKAFGQTNMIALDADKTEIADKHVTVYGGSSLVTLHKGANSYTFACARSRCEASAVVGDQPDYYSSNLGQIDARESMAQKQATAGGH